jgi:allantoate deiminase
MAPYVAEAAEIISRCRCLASLSEEKDGLTRTFLSPPMHRVHAEVGAWMERAGMNVRIDHAGNIRGFYPGPSGMPGVDAKAPRLIVGSHLDTVPHAGAFDGPLGVLLGIGLVELLGDRRLQFPIEVIGFSEEEGVRFGVPFIGSRAVVGDVDDALLGRRDSHGVSMAEAIRDFGLDPSRMQETSITEPVLAFLEMHIEQGPVLDALGLSLGVVETIVGQSRLEIRFHGQANHAGTTPMHLRRDALSGAAEWIALVERKASAMADLVATIGKIEAQPGAANVIPGAVTLTLDVRHPRDDIREQAVERFLTCGREIAGRRRLILSAEIRLTQPSVAMDETATAWLARAVQLSGRPVHRMHSGAGHDAMIMARRMPTAMLFLRSPGGISHHPDEVVMVEDVAAALDVGLRFLDELERTR